MIVNYYKESNVVEITFKRLWAACCVSLFMNIAATWAIQGTIALLVVVRRRSTRIDSVGASSWSLLIIFPKNCIVEHDGST